MRPRIYTCWNAKLRLNRNYLLTLKTSVVRFGSITYYDNEFSGTIVDFYLRNSISFHFTFFFSSHEKKNHFDFRHFNTTTTQLWLLLLFTRDYLFLSDLHLSRVFVCKCAQLIQYFWLKVQIRFRISQNIVILETVFVLLYGHYSSEPPVNKHHPKKF